MLPENNTNITIKANIGYCLCYNNQSSAEVLVERKQIDLICKTIYSHQFTYLFPSEHGRMTYWNIGNNRNARATVAITKERRKERKKQHYLYDKGCIYGGKAKQTQLM
jgi:hypothetical protein